MEASDIARITFELIRTRDDRHLMQWEDDRGILLREINRLNAIQVHNTKIHSKLQEDFIQIQKLVLTKLSKKIPRTDGFEVSNESINKRFKKEEEIGITNQVISKSPLHTSATSKSIEEELKECKQDTSKANINVEKSDKNNKIIRRYSTSNIQAAVCKPISNQNNVIKYVESGRKQSIRDTLPGFNCNQCKAYYQALIDQGNLTSESAIVIYTAIFVCSIM